MSLPIDTKFSADKSHAFSYHLGKFHPCGAKIMDVVVVMLTLVEKFTVKCIPSGNSHIVDKTQPIDKKFTPVYIKGCGYLP